MKFRSAVLAIIFLLILFFPVIQLSAQQNPFLTTDDTESAAPDSGSAKAAGTGFLAPFIESRPMQAIRGVQKKIQAEISGHIIAYKNGEDSSALLTFLLFSYAYGLLHAMGPGHRKIFLFSYFISSRTEWKKGMLAGFMTAVLHAMSAVVLIGGLYLITSKTLMTRFNNLTPLIEKISYGTIVLLGLYLLVYNIIHFRKEKTETGGPNPGTILFVLASGLIPCPGAATIMIFSIAVQAPLIGVYSVLAMSLGMGTLLAIIPPAAIILQDKLNPVIARWNPKTGERIHLAVSEAGAVVMILLGILFLI